MAAGWVAGDAWGPLHPARRLHNGLGTPVTSVTYWHPSRRYTLPLRLDKQLEACESWMDDVAFALSCDIEDVPLAMARDSLTTHARFIGGLRLAAWDAAAAAAAAAAEQQRR